MQKIAHYAVDKKIRDQSTRPVSYIPLRPTELLEVLEALEVVVWALMALEVH